MMLKAIPTIIIITTIIIKVINYHTTDKKAETPIPTLQTETIDTKTLMTVKETTVHWAGMIIVSKFLAGSLLGFNRYKTLRITVKIIINNNK